MMPQQKLLNPVTIPPKSTVPNAQPKTVIQTQLDEEINATNVRESDASYQITQTISWTVHQIAMLELMLMGKVFVDVPLIIQPQIVEKMMDLTLVPRVVQMNAIKLNSQRPIV